ncbi:MAG: hydrogenase expression/formation protein HypE [Planctomycetota bacterium]|nr:hydrogenase expression/formation protein HypE [Planctomycetota bacterium]
MSGYNEKLRRRKRSPPGGDIGRLAVFGTVNDLAVSGAEPLWLSLSLIIEEGLPIVVLEQVLDSIAIAACESGVQISTGDTKVVPRRAADGLFINTSGIGRVLEPPVPGPSSIQSGDELIITGPIGRHGLAILSAREELDLHPPPQSDCANLWPLVSTLHNTDLLRHVRAMRDATRGGVAAVLHEWAAACGLTMSIDESRIPITPDVRGASELLGLDPLYIANEGTMLLAVEPGLSDSLLTTLRKLPAGHGANTIGAVQPSASAPVVIARRTGTFRPLDDASGTILPRIC